MKTSDKVQRAASLIGRLGGHATARALTTEQRAANASHASRAKWAKLTPEQHDATVRLMCEARAAKNKQRRARENAGVQR